MKQAARIKAVIDLLDKIESSRVPMDTTIGDYMRHRRYVGSKDRAFIADTTYNVIRAHARIAWWLDRLNQTHSSRNKVIAWLLLGQGLNDFQVGQIFDGSQYAPEPLSSEETALAAGLKEQTLTHPDMPEAVQVECPPQFEETLRSYFGDEFMPEMKALMESATLDLRVNTGLAPREKVQKYLEADGVGTHPTPYSPWGLRVEGKTFLSRTKAFGKGWVDIQDEGSQLISYLAHAQPGMQVMDYCAGAGGKTLALAAAMEKKGRIVACDIDAGRLERARPRFRRAHVHDIIEVRPLSDNRHRKWLRRQKETFDIVLTDVPCTGTGTWRRNPDMRWTTYGPPLEELLETQADILDKVAKAVKPGGKLIYATCSLLPAENEEQVAAFLEREPDFEVLPLPQAWPEGKATGEGPYMRLTPHRHHTDGFFAAVLVRKSSETNSAKND